MDIFLEFFRDIYYGYAEVDGLADDLLLFCKKKEGIKSYCDKK